MEWVEVRFNFNTHGRKSAAFQHGHGRLQVSITDDFLLACSIQYGI
jgi:hypothetical protein